MTYKELKLEKGMYHITGKSFTDVLEQADPSEQYMETPLEGLDAYERQLKRFHIRVSGPCCDRVEKFFSSTQSAVLFPEFIRRAVRAGIDQSVLAEVVGVHSRSDSSDYVAGVFTDTTAYDTKTTAGQALPTATFLESSTVVRLDKYGRSIHASYEALSRQRLDVFGAMLQTVGIRLANALLKQTVTKMQAGCGSSVDVAASGTLAYTDLATLFGAFGDFNMALVLASPDNVAKIMGLEEMRDTASPQPGIILTPFGAKLKKCPGMGSDFLVGLDPRFAIEMITAGDLLLETDKLIDNQLDVITVTMRVAFRVLVADAIHLLLL